MQLFQYEIEDQHCFLRYEGSSFLVYLNSGAPSQLVCVQWDLDACQSSQLMLTCGSEYCTCVVAFLTFPEPLVS